MVHGWLSNENNGRWTLVVDNADNASVLFEPWSGEINLEMSASASARYSLADYLPSSPNGSTVMTTRDRKVAEGLIEHAEDILDVKPMVTEEAVALLMKRLKKQEPDLIRDDLVDLARELDCMPLAISQVAAYVNQRAPRVTVSKYLDELRRSDYGRAKLLQVDIRDPRRDGQASNSILTTWYVSFEYLQQKRDSAARLLSLMSLFDREGIPDYLLRGQYQKEPQGEHEHKEANENQGAGETNEIDLEDDIATLRAYDLIGVGVASDQLFNMHRLVQFSTKTWLETHNELQRWQERYINILGAAFPTGEHANWATCQALFPHVEAMEMHRVRGTDYLQVWARVLYNGAWYAMNRGQFGLAEKMARASLEVDQKILGLDDTATLNSISMLALVLRHRGQYKQAEAMHRRALTGYEKELGVNHPDTLTSMNNLALVLQDRGQYEQAEAMNRRALTGREKELGVNHPDTLTSVNNLALVLQDRGQYEQAEAMHRRALTGREKELGVNHPDTLTSVYCLAHLLNAGQDYHEALNLYQRAIVGYGKLLGPEDPTTVRCQKQMALLVEKISQRQQ